MRNSPWPNSYARVPVSSVYSICLKIFVFIYNDVLTGNLRTAVAQEDYSAVTSMIGSETFFIDLRRLKAQSYYDYEDPEILPSVCATMVSSAYFDDQYYLPVADLPDDLKRIHLKQLQIRNVSAPPYRAYIPRNIAFRNRVEQELVFSCFARTNRTRSVVEYLISREYNWNWDFRSRVRVVAVQRGHGRVGNESAAALIAMAERPARVSFDFDELDRENEWDKKYSILIDKGDIHNHFDEKDADDDDFVGRETTTTTEKPRVDDGDEGREICDTTLEQRVRLCSHMLQSEAYRGKIKYSPYKEDKFTLKSPPQCRKLELLFTHKKEIVVTKWVIECKAVDLEKMTPVVFGISVGVKSDHFLISQLSVENKNLLTAHSEHFWP